MLDIAGLKTRYFATLGVLFAVQRGVADCPSLNYVYDVGEFAYCTTVDDLDGDGDLDLVVGYRNSTSAEGTTRGLAILSNSGNGAFLPPQRLVGYAVIAIGTGDLDGDGRPDLAATTGNDVSNGTLAVFYNRGDLGFSSPVQLDVGRDPLRLAIADLDNDVRNDIVVLNRNPGSTGSIMVFRNMGFGNFQMSSIPVGVVPTSLACGDVDGDTDVDFAVEEGGGTRITILRNAGDATFPTRESLSFSHNVGDVALGDLDSDGDLDLAFTDPGNVSRAVHTRLNTGNGTFLVGQSIPLGERSTSVALADLSGNGLSEVIVVVNPIWGARIAVCANLGAGAFGPPTWIAAGRTVLTVAAADTDGDGWRDLIATETESGGVAVAANRAGEFLGADRYLSGLEPTTVTVKDFTGDGLDDVLTTYLGVLGGIGGLDLYRTILPGTLGQREPLLAQGRPVGAAVADFDNDGDPDVVVADGASYARLFALRNVNHGTFAAPELIALGVPCLGVDAGDMDGDGWSDIVVATADEEIRVLWNDGTGAWLPAVSIPIGGHLSAIRAVDLGNDGHRDVVGCIWDARRLSTIRNLGNRNFDAPILYPATVTPFRMVARDFDNDGYEDIAAVGDSDRGMIWYNLSGAGFGVAREFQTGTHHSGAIAAGDIDEDGMIDLVTGTWYGSASFLRNLGARAFGPVQRVLTSDIPTDLALGNLDGDGRVDLVVIGGGTYVPHVAVLDDVGSLPQVLRHPEPLTLCTGESAALSITTSGHPSLSIQWRKDGVPLPEAAPYSGTRTSTLTIVPTTLDEDGTYDVRLENACGFVDSLPARVAVMPVECRGDLNVDCDVNFADLARLLAQYGSGPQPPAPPEHGDIDADGDVDLTDLANLLIRFGTHCECCN